MSLSLSDSLSFAEIPLVKLVHVGKIQWKYLWICIFQTLNFFFCYLGVFAQNVPFIKQNQFCERIILRPILTCANTPNRFFGLISHFSNINFQHLYLFGKLGSWGSCMPNFGTLWSKSMEKLLVKVGHFWSNFTAAP